MYMFSETYAKKGSNEVISCLKHYFENFLPAETQDLKLWSDNSFGQNKNRYMIAYLNSRNDNFASIELNFALPGNSRMSIDRDFATIEIFRKKTDKFSFPSDSVKLVKECRISNPFTVVYVEHPLTDDLCDEGTPICEILDFKTTLDPILRPPTGINRIRGLRFLANGDVLKRYHTTGEFVIRYENIRAFSNLNQLKGLIQQAPRAYHEYVLVTPEKFQNVTTLLRFVYIPETCIFYESMRAHPLPEVVLEDQHQPVIMDIAYELPFLD